MTQQFKEKVYEFYKSKYPDAILLVRFPNEYRAFLEDARKVGEVIKSPTMSIDMEREVYIGFETRKLDTYLPKLIRAGYRIAITDDIQYE